MEGIVNPEIKSIKPVSFGAPPGAGEMGRRVNEFDWTKTSLDSVDKWPQSLRTAINIVLSSKFPMFIFWGPELLYFYNDAYRPSLGNDGKHPNCLGQPAADVWPEIWHVIKPLIDQVMAGGESTWSEDRLIPIYRNGKLEDVYWTFSYSPVIDESGKPGGVFVTCTETTDKIINIKQLEESKEQLRFAIDASELGTWDLDPSTNKFIGNERLKDWFGLQADDSIELSLALNVIAEKDRNFVAEAIKNALDYNSGGRYDIEYSIIHPVTKKERIVRAKGRAWFNNEKITIKFNGTLQDVTEQFTTRKKIEESEQRFGGAVAAMEGILWTNNAEGKMEGEQPGWALLTGQSYAVYQGYGWAKAIHPDDVVESVRMWNEAVNERKNFIFEHRVKMVDGNWGRFSIRAIPLINSDGSIREWVGVHTNITEQKEAANALFINNEQLMKINNDLDNFIYTASHDLKAPISNIEGLLIALSENLEAEKIKMTEETHLLFELIERSINRFKGTILNLTEITKVQKEQDEDVDEINLAEIVEDVKISVNNQIAESRTIITTDFSKVLALKFSKKNLNSIFYNLISNAIKYRDYNRDPEIFIKTEKTDLYTVLIIEDNGLGINEHDKSKMFTMFKRFHDHVEGTGIGLYIVKRIIDNAGGMIEVESQVGKGTTFKVYFKV
jgi:PAS domain S-box-containing protein